MPRPHRTTTTHAKPKGAKALIVMASFIMIVCFFQLYLTHKMHKSIKHNVDTSAAMDQPTTRDAASSSSQDSSTPSSSYSLERITGSTTLAAADQWQVIPPHADEAPNTEMTPKLNVIWSRGWYNAVSFPATVSMGYYNEKGRTDMQTASVYLEKYFTPDSVCASDYVWIRGRDTGWFTKQLLPQLEGRKDNHDCKFTLVTADCPYDVPDKITGGEALLQSKHVTAWYAQDVATDQYADKLFPLPLGLPIHYGFAGSPHSIHTVQTMADIRKQAKPLRDRERTIIFDQGTLGGSPRRSRYRKEAAQQLAECSNIKKWQKAPQQVFWKTLASHQFGVAPTGVGWDSFRIWELLFFGTIPIVKKSPLDLTLVPAHVPVLIVNDWSEVCEMTGEKYDAILSKYEKWVANAHHWLEPSLWLPRNQARMDELCDLSPGCTRQ